MPATSVLALPYPAGTSAGDVPFDMQQLAEAVENTLAPAWTAFTPTWASSGTAPTLGNGTITGRVRQIGKIVFYSIRLTIGSTSTFGTGVYSLSLPTTSVLGVGLPAGTAIVQDVSAGTLNALNAVGIASTAVGLVDVAGVAGTRFAQGTPVTLATGDIVTVNGTYEAA